MEVHVRPENPDDALAIDQVHERAFGGPYLVRLVQAVRASPRYRAERSLVAVGNRRVIGHVLLHAVGVEDDGGTRRRIAVIAPLAVLPECHRQGVGTALMQAALATFERAATPVVVLRGDPRYYQRFGFTPAERFGIRAPFSVDTNEYLAKPLAHYEPAYRGTVSYPPAFATVGYPVESAHTEVDA